MENSCNTQIKIVSTRKTTLKSIGVALLEISGVELLELLVFDMDLWKNIKYVFYVVHVYEVLSRTHEILKS